MTVLPVSAIVPTYNRADFLSQSIDSILAGIARPAEIIVIDDGSSDGTMHRVATFGGRVRYARQANAGKSAALNHALGLAVNPFVWIMDDDDLARPEGLVRLFEALSADPGAGFSFGRYETFGDAKTTEQRLPLVPHPDAESFFLGELLGCSVLQPAMLVRRTCYTAVGPFDTSLLRSQDYDMLLRLARRFAAVRIDDVVFDQRQHDAARGTAELQRRRQSPAMLWRQYDKQIFRRIHKDYVLSEYLPSADHADVAIRHRALVRRAGLMGRRGLWDLALGDLALAAACPRQHLKPADLKVFRSALFPYSPSQERIPLRKIGRTVRTFAGESRDLLLPLVRESVLIRWRTRLRGVPHRLMRVRF